MLINNVHVHCLLEIFLKVPEVSIPDWRSRNIHPDNSYLCPLLFTGTLLAAFAFLPLLPLPLRQPC